MNSFIILNGALLPVQEARISPLDHGFLYGDGVYETIRTHQGEIFDFHSHYSRLKNSAKILDIPLLWKEKEILQMSTDLIAAHTFHSEKKEFRIRITLTRGENNYHFLGAKSPTLLITISPLKNYTEEKKGVCVTSLQIERILPEAKTISLLVNNLAKQQVTRKGVFECLLIDHEGFLTEGAISNVLSRRGNTIFYTPKQYILAGTAQKRVLEIAKTLGIPTKEKRHTLADLQNADEAFLTNSLFDILPIKKVEQKEIANCPGEYYNKISSLLTKV